MSISASVSTDGVCRIEILGRFDFSLHSEFKAAYEGSEGDIKEYILDLAGAEYMDSSALGMLLVMREFAEGRKARVRIENVSSEVKKLLEIANYEKLFDIA